MTPAEARERIRAHADLNAFISLTVEEGDGPIVAIKDLVDVRGMITTAGGSFVPSAPADQDAPLVRRMREFGCVVIGKTNLHEWAFGVTSQNPHHGGVRNPRAPDRIPGGSSGGSAAAVAAGLCDWAVGSDTGGSIRVPARSPSSGLRCRAAGVRAWSPRSPRPGPGLRRGSPRSSSLTASAWARPV